jgi:hypothetical protein
MSAALFCLFSCILVSRETTGQTLRGRIVEEGPRPVAHEYYPARAILSFWRFVHLPSLF